MNIPTHNLAQTATGCLPGHEANFDLMLYSWRNFDLWMRCAERTALTNSKNQTNYELFEMQCLQNCSLCMQPACPVGMASMKCIMQINLVLPVSKVKMRNDNQHSNTL